MPRRRFSLGGAIWGFPSAYGCRAPFKNAPDAWLLILLQKHGAAVFQGIFTSCRAGKAWVLHNAPKAQVKLSVSAQQGSAAWVKQLSAVDSDLAIRHRQRTVLTITFDQDDSKDCLPAPDHLSGDQALLTIPSLLNTTSQSISELQVLFEGGPNHDLARLFMKRAAKVFKTATTFEAPTGILPPLDELANATKLSIPCPYGPDDADINKSIGLLVPQLTELSYTRGQPGPSHYFAPEPVWTQVFTSTSHTLTRFTTAYELTDKLAKLLSKHTPRLADLHVSGVSLTHKSRALHWSVKRLFIDQGDAYAYVSRLANLPRHKGQLQLEARDSWTFALHNAEGGDANLIERLPEFIFSVPQAAQPASHYQECGKVAFRVAGHLSHGNARNCLQHLGSFQTTNMSVVELSYYDWTPVAAQAVANAMRAVAHRFIFGVRVGHLTDQTVSSLVILGPLIRGVSTHIISTRAAQYPTGSVWASGEISVTNQVALSSLLHMPPPAEGDHCVVRCSALCLQESLTKNALQSLPGRLQHIRFEPLTTSSRCDIHIGTHNNKNARSKLPLRSQIALLPNIHVESVPMRIVWTGPLTRAAVDALQALPDRAGVIDLSEATWPLKSADYRDMAKSIPVGYTEWVLKIKVPSEYSEAIFQGISARRRGMRSPPLRLRIIGKVAEGVRVGKHITIVQ